MGYLLKEHQLLYSEQSHLDVLPSLPIPIGQEVFYLAPTMAGSRGSAGIAGAWYALVSIGKKKYTELA